MSTRPPPQLTAAPVAPAAFPHTVADAADLALLIVDDRPENLLVLEAVLEPLGVPLVRAGSGHEALARVAEQDYAAVLLDVHMPGIDGFETARAIRARNRARAAVDASTAPTPILFLTAGDITDRTRLAQAYALGAVDVIGKPLDPDALRAKAQVFVDLARARVNAARVAAARATERVELERARAAETAMRASEERYRFLAETMPVLVWTAHANGLLDYVSEQVARYTGRPAEQIVGNSWVGVLHPEDMDRVQAQWQRSVETGERYVTEFRIWSHTDQAFRWHLVRAVPRRDASGRVVAWVGTNTDVEDQRRAAEERRQLLADERAARAEAQQKRLEAEQAVERARRLQEATAALTMAATPEHVARVIAEECARALDAVVSAVVRVSEDGGSVEPVGSHGFPPGHFDRWPSIPMTAEVPLVEAIRTGRLLWLESPARGVTRYPAIEAMREVVHHGSWVLLPLVYSGAVLGGVALVLRGERPSNADDEAFLGALAPLCAQALERARLYAAEQEARRAAEAANRAKSEFLSTMSHELRTPLNAIGGYVDLMELGIRGPITDAQRADLARIKRSSQHLLSLINDILNFARLEAGQVDFRIGDVPMAALVSDVEGLIAPQLDAKGLAYEQQVVGAPVARGDPERLRQVLLNLLTNAVKFTDVGGAISLHCDGDATAVRVRVVDTGRGIAADQLAEIFEPFVQVDRHLTHASQQGVGLGLAISRDLARRMGGELTAASVVGEGSVFTLTLPRGDG